MTDTTPALPVVAWQANYIDRFGVHCLYTTSEQELAIENDTNGTPVPLCDHAAATTALTAALARAAELERENAALHDFRRENEEVQNVISAQIFQLERERDALRAALVELVAVEELYAAMYGEAMDCGDTKSMTLMEMEVEYQRRQPLAWAAARAAVAAVPMLPNSDEAALRHQAGRLTPGVRSDGEDAS